MIHVSASSNPTRREQDLQYLVLRFMARPRMCADARRKSDLVCFTSAKEA
jgi:hypothetical protein